MAGCSGAALVTTRCDTATHEAPATLALPGADVGSQVLGPFDQGAIIGWQQVAGSVARMTGPLWAGELYSVRGRCGAPPAAAGCHI